MVPTTPTPLFGGILENEGLSPLKRNSACLQCRKRKAKCDGTKPSCSTCLRAHVRAIKLAQKAGDTIPDVDCTYSESHLDGEEGEDNSASSCRADLGDKMSQKRHSARVKAIKLARRNRLPLCRQPVLDIGTRLQNHVAVDTITARKVSSRETLWNDAVGNPTSHAPTSLSAPKQAVTNSDGSVDLSVSTPSWNETESRIPSDESSFAPATSAEPMPSVVADDLPAANVDDLMMIPTHWPKGLPAPFLLHHLVETFFNCVPQLPQMIHRATLYHRLGLPPTHVEFPHASLLHAICASGSAHTSWVPSMDPEAGEQATMHSSCAALPDDKFNDIGLLQAYAAKYSIDTMAARCTYGGERALFQVTQASIILAEVFHQRGMSQQAWLMASTGPRLIRSMGLGHRFQPISCREDVISPHDDAIDREERLATVWQAHIQDTAYSARINLPSASAVIDISTSTTAIGNSGIPFKGSGMTMAFDGVLPVLEAEMLAACIMEEVPVYDSRPSASQSVPIPYTKDTSFGSATDAMPCASASILSSMNPATISGSSFSSVNLPLDGSDLHAELLPLGSDDKNKNVSSSSALVGCQNHQVIRTDMFQLDMQIGTMPSYPDSLAHDLNVHLDPPAEPSGSTIPISALASVGTDWTIEDQIFDFLYFDPSGDLTMNCPDLGHV